MIRINRYAHNLGQPTGTMSSQIPFTAQSVTDTNSSDHSTFSWHMQYMKALAERNRWHSTLTAIEMSGALHANQFRKSGAPYFTHPTRVATMLVCYGVDCDRGLTKAFLHDVFEDCSDRITPSELSAVRGFDARLVPDLIALTKTYADSKSDYFTRVGRSLDAVAVKLADRLDNLRDLDVFPTWKICEYLKETFEWILPLGRRAVSSFPDHSAVIQSLTSTIEYFLAQYASRGYQFKYDGAELGFLDTEER